jgi:hypothetical protein
LLKAGESPHQLGLAVARDARDANDLRPRRLKAQSLSGNFRRDCISFSASGELTRV